MVGHTGSGKSTQIPQYLLLENLTKSIDKMIYCVLPRKLAARSLAARVADELLSLKDKVGFDFGRLWRGL